MIEYLSASGEWRKLNSDYKLGEWTFWGNTEFNKSMFRINNKIYSEYSKELVKVYEQERMWEKLKK